MPKYKRQDNAGRGRASTRVRASTRGRAPARGRATSRPTTRSSTRVFTPSITADSRSATGGGQPPATGLQPSSSGHSADYDGAVLQQTSPDISSVGSLPLEQLLSVVRAQVRAEMQANQPLVPSSTVPLAQQCGIQPMANQAQPRQAQQPLCGLPTHHPVPEVIGQQSSQPPSAFPFPSARQLPGLQCMKEWIHG